MMGNRGKVNTKWQNGEKTNKKHNLNFPKIQRPTDACWTIWKEFIFGNFITCNSKINPPLKTKPHPNNTTIRTVTISENKTLSGIINTLPCTKKQILGEMEFQENHLHHILQLYNNGYIICGSNGSLVVVGVVRKGTHAFSIQSYDNDVGKIKGRAFTPLSTTMSSRTVESYGVLSNLILLQALNMLNDNMVGKPIIRVILDNKEVIKR